MNIQTKPCEHCGGTGQVIDNLSVGEDLRRMREAAGLSLREVAARLSVSPAYLSDLELGRRNWSDSKIANYTQAIGKAAA